MTHTFYCMYAHIVFSTRGRRDWIRREDENEVFAYLAAAVRNQGCQALIVGGHLNHVHLLVGLGKSTTIPTLVKEIKRTSSIWLHERNGEFAWQEGYGAFSVSHSNLEAAERYIRNQAAHHARMTWEEEIRGILERHGVAFDERFYLGG